MRLNTGLISSFESQDTVSTILEHCIFHAVKTYEGWFELDVSQLLGIKFLNQKVQGLIGLDQIISRVQVKSI